MSGGPYPGRWRRQRPERASSRRLNTSAAEFSIKVPGDREDTFEPQLVRSGQRRLPGFDEKVLALYARGMTTREIPSTPTAARSSTSTATGNASSHTSNRGE
jgi:transposase-like protein